MPEDSDEETNDEVRDHVPGYYGPTSWEDVDQTELMRVALHISQNVVPSTEQNSDVAARLAMQAAALSAETMDPLGLGRIDTRSLTLVQARADRPGGRSRGPRKSISIETGGPGARPNLRRVKQERASGSGDGGAEASGLTPLQQRVGGSVSLSLLRNKVSPSSELFDAAVYLGLIHADTSLEELQEGRYSLKAELSERTGQLKALVKDNFDRFISCKNTIDDIHARLLKAEKARGGDAQGVSSSDMVLAVGEIQEEARRTFAALLERATMSDRIRDVIALLKRYESLFRLPTRIRQASQDGQYEQVISEHRKSKALVQSIVQPRAESRIWHNLFVEVEKAVEAMVAALAGRLREPSTSLSEAAEACKHVLQLSLDGAACAAALDPLALYLQAQDSRLQQVMEEAAEEQRQQLAQLRERAADREASDARWRQLQTDEQGSSGQATPVSSVVSRGGLPAESPRACHRGGALRAALQAPDQLSSDSVWSAFAARLSSDLTRHLPVLWILPQEKLKPLMNLSPRAKQVIQGGVQDGLKRVRQALDIYGEHIRASFVALSEEPGSQATFLAVLKSATSTVRSLQEAGGPEEPLRALLQKVLEAATQAALTEMAAERCLLLANIALLANWVPIPGTHKTGTPVSKLPGMLEEVVTKGMDRIQAVHSEAIAATDTSSSSAPPSSSNKVREAFYECFKSYAIATDKLAAATTTEGVGPEQPGAVPPDMKLLVLVSDCSHVRSHLMPRLALRYSGVLGREKGGDQPRQLAAAASAELEQVEGRLVNMYLESKSAVINDMLEEYFTGDGTSWAAAPVPTSLRDVAFDLVNVLVEIEAEVYAGAPSIRKHMMQEVVEMLLSAAHAVIAEELTSANVGGLLQLWVEVLYFKRVLGAHSSKADEQCQETLRLIAKRVLDALKAANPQDLVDLQRFTLGVQEGPAMQKLKAASDVMAKNAMVHSKLNIVCFRTASSPAS